MTAKKYEPTWNSLKRHRRPEWLDDAKFGIYFHWGVYSVPAFLNEWYPHHMYNPPHPVYIYHKKKYGGPSKFGYKDFIEDFTAQYFEPDEWARLFKEAGAKFAGPVAEHHDGFSMWDSKVNKWNSVNMGPKRDIVGEMEKAVRKQGMKYICTFHHANLWYYYNHQERYDTGDPEYSGLYGPAHGSGIKGSSSRKQDRPNKEFLDVWLEKLKEVIDNYRPDLIWFDFGLKNIHDKYKRRMAAYYYNKGEEWGKEVEILYKRHNLPPSIGILDYERGRSDKMTHHKWITDTILSKSSWSYIKKQKFKSIDTLIHNFTDRIAKNGYLLLNVGPTPDGKLPQEIRDRLKELGEWIKVNGEAIYNSSPWVLAEEGPTKMRKSGGFSEHREVSYSADDLRFVAKNNALYVFCLGWPGERLQIKSLTKPPKYRWPWRYPKDFYLLEESDIKNIYLLGIEEPLDWKITNQGLIIETPNRKPCEHAYTFKIAWRDI